MAMCPFVWIKWLLLFVVWSCLVWWWWFVMVWNGRTTSDCVMHSHRNINKTFNAFAIAFYRSFEKKISVDFPFTLYGSHRSWPSLTNSIKISSKDQFLSFVFCRNHLFSVENWFFYVSLTVLSLFLSVIENCLLRTWEFSLICFCRTQNEQKS